MFLKDEVPSVELKETMGIEVVTEVVKTNWLRWVRYVLQKDDGDFTMKRSILYEVDGMRGIGRLRMTWNQVMEKGMTEYGLKMVDVQDWENEEDSCGNPQTNPFIRGENSHKMLFVCV